MAESAEYANMKGVPQNLRGIERGKIFHDDTDREDFLGRLGKAQQIAENLACDRMG